MYNVWLSIFHFMTFIFICQKQNKFIFHFSLTIWNTFDVMEDELSLPLNYSFSYIVWLYFQSYEKYLICHKYLNVIYKCHQFVNIWFKYFKIIHNNSWYAKIYRLWLCCNRYMHTLAHWVFKLYECPYCVSSYRLHWYARTPRITPEQTCFDPIMGWALLRWHFKVMFSYW